jgi:hypothetical protein
MQTLSGTEDRAAEAVGDHDVVTNTNAEHTGLPLE